MTRTPSDGLVEQSPIGAAHFHSYLTLTDQIVIANEPNSLR